MPVVLHPHIRDLLSGAFGQNDSFGGNSGRNKAQEVVANVRSNKANGQQYPYPSSTLDADPTFGAMSNVRFPPNPTNLQDGQETAQAPIQVSQPESSTAVMSGTSSVASSISSSTSSSTSAISSSSTSSGSTLWVPFPMPHPSSTTPPSLTSLTQTVSYTESSATEPTDVSSVPSTSNNTLPPVAIGLLIGVGGVVLLTVGVFVVLCIRRQRRHRRRREEAAEKDAWDDVNTTPGRPDEGDTIFGGRERTGLTPQPSWTTFSEAGRVGPSSPYPLGLIPPPSTSHLAPSWHAQGASGQGTPYRGYTPGHGGTNYQPYAAGVRPFEPPTITITSSSPRQSAHNLLNHPTISHRQTNRLPPTSSSQSDTSSGNSYNRVSVYTDPVHGTRLMKPPRLKLVNSNPSLSESDGGARNSGWSSWDDNVGVELGVTIDRKLAPPRRKSRTPVPKAKGSTSPLRNILAPVQEASEVCDTAVIKPPPRKPLALSSARLHPQSPNQRRQGSPSSASLQRSPRATRSPSPKALKGKNSSQQVESQRLYDLPRFNSTSPGGNDSMRVASPSSISASPVGELEHDSNFSKRRSKRASKRASSARSPRPSSAGSYALSKTYAYIYSQGFSSTESEEMQVRSTSKRSSARSQEGGVETWLKGVMSTSPAVSDTVGALMMKAYDDEGAIPSPSLPQLKEKKKEDGTGGKVPRNRKHALGESTRVNIPKSAIRSGATNPNQKPRQQKSTAGISSRQQKGAATATAASRDADTHHSGGDSPQSVYSEHPGHQPTSRNLPSLPPPGMPNLYQLKLMREMPDYRSPTYSVYGMYRDENSVSPLQGSPVEYRYASSTAAWESNVI